MIDPHTALVYTMVLVSAADRDMSDAELGTIGDTVKHLPIFASYDFENLMDAGQDVAERLNADGGLDKVLDLISESMPSSLTETAYALACEVAAADGKLSQEELRLLELLRDRLLVDRLSAAAIERTTRARYARLPAAG